MTPTIPTHIRSRRSHRTLTTTTSRALLVGLATAALMMAGIPLAGAATNDVATVAGSVLGSVDANGLNASFSAPLAADVDAAGNVYLADSANHRIRRIDPAGNVTTLAGSTPGYVDANGTNAQFEVPTGIVVDRRGNVYVSDFDNGVIRRIDPAGNVTTVAGSTPGHLDGRATNAQFSGPRGLAIDGTGNLYVADDQTIRRIDALGNVTTLAGSTTGYVDAQGASARFGLVFDLAVDSSGAVYATDSVNDAIRRIAPDGTVTTFAGGTNGTADGTGTGARFSGPRGIVIDSAGNLLVADAGNHRIRRVSSGGDVVTIAGSIDGDVDGSGLGAQFSSPMGIALAPDGSLYVAEYYSSLIRRMELTVGAPAVPLEPSFGSSSPPAFPYAPAAGSPVVGSSGEAAPVTVMPTTVAAETPPMTAAPVASPSTTAPSTTAPSPDVLALVSAEPTADQATTVPVESLALTGSNTVRLLMISVLMIGAGLLLTVAGGRGRHRPLRR